jgi:hypothetical protein
MISKAAISQLPPPPIFGVIGSNSEDSRNAARSGIISLVDIFDDFLFSGDQNTSLGDATGLGTELEQAGDDEADYASDGMDDSIDGKQSKRSRTLQRNMTEEQKVERR